MLNLPLAAVAVVATRHVPETSDPAAQGRLDFAGAVLGAAALAAGTYALIQAQADATTVAMGVVAVAGVVAFVIVERRVEHPMLPLSMFSSRQFTSFCHCRVETETRKIRSA